MTSSLAMQLRDQEANQLWWWQCMQAIEYASSFLTATSRAYTYTCAFRLPMDKVSFTRSQHPISLPDLASLHNSSKTQPFSRR